MALGQFSVTDRPLCTGHWARRSAGAEEMGGPAPAFREQTNLGLLRRGESLPNLASGRLIHLSGEERRTRQGQIKVPSDQGLHSAELLGQPASRPPFPLPKLSGTYDNLQSEDFKSQSNHLMIITDHLKKIPLQKKNIRSQL